MKPKCNNISVTSMVSARRKSSSLIREGRDRGFPRIDHDDFSNILKLETDVVLAMMKNMTAEEAAAVAAVAVAEAEAAMAKAEEAIREAEAAEADAQAAEAALKTLIEEETLRNDDDMLNDFWYGISELEPESD